MGGTEAKRKRERLAEEEVRRKAIINDVARTTGLSYLTVLDLFFKGWRYVELPNKPPRWEKN